MSDGLGRAPDAESSTDSDPPHGPGLSPLASPRSQHMRSSSQLQSPRMSDLVRDSKLETHFLPDSSVETVHTYHEPDYKSRRRLVSRSEHWRRYGKIGGGSYGSVWLEKCTKGARRENGLRAIKQMEVRRQSTRVDYHRELEAIAKFSHWKYERAFVKSFGWYESPDHLFIAMEYLELGDLHTYLHQKPALPEREAKEITFQILDGLFLMHDNEFAHRDMKPRNILIKSCPPDEWWVKIADFGISKRIEDEIGQSSTLKGTLGYIAPELHGFIQRGSPYAPDLWAVGEIAFQMLTTQSSFKNLGVLFQYMNSLEIFPYDVLITTDVSQSGQECLFSLLHPDPTLRATAEMALEHAWFNEAPLSRQGSVRSARNASPPAPLADADPEAEELATWNTLATQESESSSPNQIHETPMGTWNTEANHWTNIGLDPRQLSFFPAQTSDDSMAGNIGPVVDARQGEVDYGPPNAVTSSESLVLRPHGHYRDTLPEQATDHSKDSEHAEGSSAITQQANTNQQPGIVFSADEAAPRTTYSTSNARRFLGPSQATDNSIGSMPPNITIGGTIAGSELPEPHQMRSWDTYTTLNQPQSTVQMQTPSLVVHAGNDEPETFIAQRMREIWDSRSRADPLSGESNLRESYDYSGSPAPPAPGITSSSERPEWQPQENVTTKDTPDGISKIKKMFSRFRTKEAEPPSNNAHSEPLPENPIERPGGMRTIFGISIDELYARFPKMPVPLVVQDCIWAVETYGLDLEGIYRQSEKPDTIARMISRFEFNWPHHDLKLPANFHHNIHNAANLLKRFFRDLPIPLLGFDNYQAFLNAAKIDDDIVRRDSIHAIINSLTDPNYVTLRALAFHLHKVQQHSPRNRMTTGNLAIIFGPTLMGTSSRNPVDAGWQIRTVETIIHYALDIFDED